MALMWDEVIVPLSVCFIHAQAQTDIDCGNESMLIMINKQIVVLPEEAVK